MLLFREYRRENVSAKNTTKLAYSAVLLPTAMITPAKFHRFARSNRLDLAEFA
jgi:hypothetical protein